MTFSKKEAPDCDTCPAKANCLYFYLDRPAQTAWKTLRTACAYRDGELLFSEGDKPAGLFIICKGRIKICNTSTTGQQLIARIEEAGDLVGHIALLAHGNFQANGEIMGETIVSLIDQAMFIDFLRKHPNASIALMEALARDVREGESKARDIAYKPAKSRMADVLLKTLEKNSKTSSKSVILGVKRRELAEMAGLTVETAVRILAEFEKKKILKRDSKAITILDKNRLKEISSSEE